MRFCDASWAYGEIMLLVQFGGSCLSEIKSGVAFPLCNKWKTVFKSHFQTLNWLWKCLIIFYLQELYCYYLEVKNSMKDLVHNEVITAGAIGTGTLK